MKKDATDKQIMMITRITLLVVAIVGIIIALDESSIIFKVVSFAWAGFGATFGPIILFSLFWKKDDQGRRNRRYAYRRCYSICFGSCCLNRLGGVFGIYELLPAFILSCIAIVVVSMLSKKA